jgi:hypothetical protein
MRITREKIQDWVGCQELVSRDLVMKNSVIPSREDGEGPHKCNDGYHEPDVDARQ